MYFNIFVLLPINKGSFSFHSIDSTLSGLSHLFLSHLFPEVECKNKRSVHILYIRKQQLVQTTYIYIYLIKCHSSCEKVNKTMY